MKSSAVVFIHGLLSSNNVWTRFADLLRNDSDVSDTYDVRFFDYASPRWNLSKLRRIPDFSVIADSLTTFFDVEGRQYDRIVLVGHSQGGLIIQRFLAKMLADARGEDLAKIRRVILFACPNSGSELLLLFRTSLRFWRHAQERELRPLADSVIEAQRRVLRGIVYANGMSNDRCPIPFAVYAGESDNVVTPISATSVFPEAGALPGDHFTIVQPDSLIHRSYTTLRSNLFLALEQPDPIPSEAEERTASVMAHPTRDTMYDTVASTIVTLDAEGPGERQILHAALHSIGPRLPDPTSAALLAFDAAYARCVESCGAASWHVKSLFNLTSEERLDKVVSRLRGWEDAEDFEVRCFVLPDSLPHLAPLILGSRHVFVAIDDQRFHRVRRGLHIQSDRVATEMTGYFDELWRDSRAFRLRTPRGIDETVVVAAREAIRLLPSMPS